MFGLISSAELEATKNNTYRRAVFYQYPQGTAPLMGLLSLMDEGEQLADQTFGWHEYRDQVLASTLTAVGGAGPFTDTSGASGSATGSVALTAGGWTQAAGTTIRMEVADASLYRVRDKIWIKDQPFASSAVGQIYGVVDAVWTSPNTIDVRLTETVTNALNNVSAYVSGGASGGNVGAQVNIVGSTAVEGGYSKLGGVTLPLQAANYTQTFRTTVGPWTRAALKKPQLFDKSGIYRHDSHQACLRHMKVLEQAAFFARRGTRTVTDPDDNLAKTEKETGGIYWFLQQWELGNVSNGGAFEYRPSGSDLTASAWNANDDKRILKINGTLTETQFDSILERAFRYTGDSGFEKLVLCGPTFFTVINAYVKRAALRVTQLNSKDETYGMTMTRISSPYGDIVIKVHPLFLQNPILQSSAFILDMGSIMYHSLNDSDTTLLKNRQANDFDGRKDEWLTEYGLEIKYPERHMYIEGLTAITP